MLIASSSRRDVFSALLSTRRYLLLTAALFLLIALGATRPAHAATLTVPAGGNLQAALDGAVAGDTIILEAGATYVGPFTLPAKPAAGDLWITIQSSALAQLPPSGTRVTPAHAALMPKLVSPGSNLPALRTAAYAHHYRFVGIEVTSVNASAFVRELVQLGDGSAAQNSLAQVPHHLTLERCYLHGVGDQEVVRAVALNSASTEVRDSYISNIKHRSFDSQAAWGWNGPGPFRIENNYLEAAGENAGFGGAIPGIAGLVPSDIEFRRNTVTKPLDWRGRYLVKNLFELKSAQRVVIEGNVFENNWGPEQGGFAIVLTVRTEVCNAMQNTIEDVSFTNNTVRHVGGGINILGRDDFPGCTSRRARNLKVSNNLFDDVAKAWGGHGHFLQMTDTEAVEVAHNTVMHEGTLVMAYGAASAGFQYRDNLSRHGEYGIFGGGQSPGNASIRTYFPGGAINRNVIASAPEWVYPANNFYPASWSEVQFVDAANGNYRLVANHLYTNAGTDGKDVGCDFNQLETAMGKATVTPTPTPTPTATPTPTPSNSLSAPALVAAARTAAATLAAAPSVSDAEINVLENKIEAAYAAYTREANQFPASALIDGGLRVSLYFSRASEALAAAGATSTSVQNRLQITTSRLAQVNDLMLPPTSATAAAGENAHAPAAATNLPFIGAANTFSSASLAPMLSPRSLGTITGDAAQSPLASSGVIADTSGNKALPFELAGASVSVGGRAAPLLYVSPSRISFLVPQDLPQGEVEVIVTSQDGYVSRGTTTINAHAPALFTANASGAGQALVMNGSEPGAPSFDVQSPHAFGTDKRTRIMLYATGISAGAANLYADNDVRSASGSGMIANVAESLTVEARTTDGRVYHLTVEFAGAVEGRVPGLDQINVVLNPELRGAGPVDLTIIINGQRSNTAAISIR